MLFIFCVSFRQCPIFFGVCVLIDRDMRVLLHTLANQFRCGFTFFGQFRCLSFQFHSIGNFSQGNPAIFNDLGFIADISAFAEELKGFDYDLVLTSHYVPEGQDAVETKIAYLEKTLELSDTCADAASFIEAMNEAFPDYSGANYLETTAGMLYQ